MDGLRYEVAAGNIRPNTLATYEVDLTSKVTPRIGTLRLSTLTRDVIRSLNADLLASGARGGKPLAPKSVKNIANALKRALDDTVDSGVLRANPVARVKTPTAGRPIISTWSPSETQHFLVDGASGRDVHEVHFNIEAACEEQWATKPLVTREASLVGLAGFGPAAS